MSRYSMSGWLLPTRKLVVKQEKRDAMSHCPTCDAAALTSPMVSGPMQRTVVFCRAPHYSTLRHCPNGWLLRRTAYAQLDFARDDETKL